MKETNEEKLAAVYLERNPSVKESDVVTILLNCSACRFIAIAFPLVLMEMANRNSIDLRVAYTSIVYFRRLYSQLS